ncbi:MAG: hypothetical protein AUG74_02815 [Bacteroidetes bacterium 13_1_20CM_4_60_6]|nr:MAG: hypothetical protein AUG74_02815 [Bacteroidetes bacterium 13_1_20CM_4_60_6]
MAWAAVLILVAYLSREVKYVLNVAFSLRGLTSGALLAGLLLVLFWRKGPAAPVIIGMLGAVTAMVAIYRETEIAWPWYTLIGTAVAVGIAIVMRVLLNLQKQPQPV